LSTPTLLRFRDLKEQKIVANRMTLKNWIEHEGFPPGRMLAANTRVWFLDEIAAWLDSRPVGGRDTTRRRAR
jgi:hypothetical protein